MNEMPMGETLERIQCQWCQGMNAKAALNCQACGAPLDIRNLVSESGRNRQGSQNEVFLVRFRNVWCRSVGGAKRLSPMRCGVGLAKWQDAFGLGQTAGPQGHGEAAVWELILPN
jgi:hypothetical protein